jgi:excinuclease ABC subunit C
MPAAGDSEALLKGIPRRIGVYFLKDERDRIIYIGKAVDLRSRIRSHLTAQPVQPKAPMLARRVRAVDYIPCETEVEALVLEQNLIKEHRPRYNVDLKDDKRYPYLKLTSEKFPRIFKTRDLRDDDARYFGPYTSVGSMEGMLKSLLSIFPLRTCDYEIPFKDPSLRECLEYHIGRCEAPCTRRVDQAHYGHMVDQVELFLEGHTEALVERLEGQMEEASGARNYEHATLLRDRINGIRRATERQRVVSERKVDFDVVAHAREGKTGFGVIFQIREGRLIGRDMYTLSAPLSQEDPEILSGLVIRHYFRASHIPPAVYVERHPPERDLLAQALAGRRGAAVRILLARQGTPSEVMELASTDARFRLRDLLLRREQRSDFVPIAVEELQRALDLPRPPLTIEAFDVSHVQGSDAVAAMVRFHRGSPVKSGYRKFQLKHAAAGDDPAGIAEAVERKYRRTLQEEGEDGLPDLVLIDGGLTQLTAALRVLNSLEIDRERLPVLGLAKRLEEVYLPDVDGPQSLARTGAALRLLQRVRDEVHRYVLGYHRQKRGGRVRATLLTEVHGVGESRARRLLQTFGSVRRMIQSGEEAIARVDGIGPVLARRIADAMGGDKEDA